MVKRIEGSSLGLVIDFYDENDDPVTPTNLDYELLNEDDEILLSGSDTPSSSSYTLNISPTVNTLPDGVEEEKRRVIISWTYGGGSKGDVKVYRYRLVKA